MIQTEERHPREFTVSERHYEHLFYSCAINNVYKYLIYKILDIEKTQVECLNIYAYLDFEGDIIHKIIKLIGTSQ